MSEEVIKVLNVSKDFRLPQQRANSLKSLFTSLPRKKNRKVDVQHALKNVTFEVKKGEFFGIVGRNGSGKSTLLKMLAGIYQPTDGSIKVEGRLVPFIELGVGFNPELTGKQNVYLSGALLGFSEKEVNAQYEDIVSFAELKPFMDQKLKNYSSGMQVRLAFSVAVRAKADILLIDEVLAVGDADFQRKCFNYFSQLRREDTTVVFVSHDMDAVREYCDRAMLIEKNEIVDIGATDQIADKYTRLFIKSHSHDTGTGFGEEKRWGDRGISVSDIEVKVDSRRVVIKERIKASKDIDGLIAGIRLRDSTGSDITGTNTKIEKKKILPMKAKSFVTIEWSIPNVFRDGVYTVDPAIHYSDGVTVADWWDDAASFTIVKNRHVPYVIDPGFGLKVEYKK